MDLNLIVSGIRAPLFLRPHPINNVTQGTAHTQKIKNKITVTLRNIQFNLFKCFNFETMVYNIHMILLSCPARPASRRTVARPIYKWIVTRIVLVWRNGRIIRSYHGPLLERKQLFSLVIVNNDPEPGR